MSWLPKASIVAFRPHHGLPLDEVIASCPFEDRSAALAAKEGAKPPLCPTFLRRSINKRAVGTAKMDNRKSVVAHELMMSLSSTFFQPERNRRALAHSG